MNDRFKKAEKFLETSELCKDNEDYDSCVSRCYYSVLHASIASLENIGISQDKWSHSGVRNTFGKELIADRKMFTKEFGKYLHELYDIRLIGDYKINEITKDHAENALIKSKKFIKGVKKVLK
ncbi:MAG: HEPN domain-containing protein [Methanosarcinales archaeon]